MNGELYHYGVLGMKWGVRRTPAQLRAEYELSRQKKKDREQDKARAQRLRNARKKSKQLEKEQKHKTKQLEKKKKRRSELSGEKASLSKMNDAERRRYARNRVKETGSKQKAIAYDTGHYAGKILKTAGIIGGATLLSALTGGGIAAAIPMTSATTYSGTTITALLGTGAKFTMGALAGGALGGVSAGSAGVTNLAVKGSRYVRNLIEIGTSDDSSRK